MKRIFVLTLMLAVGLWCLGATRTTTRKVTGSAMISVYLPSELEKVTVSGTVDGKNYTNLQLYNGIDFICQRITGGGTVNFEYCSYDAPLGPGGYVFQFADNYDGLTVSFSFQSASETNPDAETSYCIAGNMSVVKKKVTTPIYVMNEAEQKFEYLPEGGYLNPYEAYILTNEENPVPYFAPNGSVGIERLMWTDITRERVIHNLNGQRIVNLQKGVNIIGRKKFLLR